MARVPKLKALSPEDVYRKLKDHPSWVVERSRIYRDFRFETFREALKFVLGVGAIAEKLRHHPNIFMHEYHFVRVETYTHLTGGLSAKDVELAKTIAKLLPPGR